MHSMIFKFWLQSIQRGVRRNSSITTQRDGPINIPHSVC